MIYPAYFVLNLNVFSHLFFECTVAREIWNEINLITRVRVLPTTFESVGSLWVSENKHVVVNVIHVTTL
jgi:hypothetical protein